MEPTRILIADYYTIHREGLRTILNSGRYNIVGEARNSKEALDSARRLHPDIAIINSDLPIPNLPLGNDQVTYGNGIRISKEILIDSPKTHITILGPDDKSYLAKSLIAGVRGYITMEDSEKEVIESVESLKRGQFYIPSRYKDVIVSPLSFINDPVYMLTPREFQVFGLLTAGLSNKDIARKMDLAVKTIESHRERAMRKLKVHSLVGLAKIALRNGHATL